MKVIFPLFSQLLSHCLLAVIYEIFPHWGKVYFGGLLGETFCEEAIFKMGDTNLIKKS